MKIKKVRKAPSLLSLVDTLNGRIPHLRHAVKKGVKSSITSEVGVMLEVLGKLITTGKLSK